MSAGYVKTAPVAANGTSEVTLCAAPDDAYSWVYGLDLEVTALAATAASRTVSVLDAPSGNVLYTFVVPAGTVGTVSQDPNSLKGRLISGRGSALVFKLDGSGTDFKIGGAFWVGRGAPREWGL